MIQDAYPGRQSKYGDAPTQIQVLSGPLEGPFRELSPRCDHFHFGAFNVPSSSIAIEDELVAARGPNCSENTLRDFSSSTSSPRPLPTQVREVQMAGRYMAWLSAPRDQSANHSESDVVVFDRIADREVYRIPKEALKLRVDTLDVRDDGRVVVAISRGVTPPGEDVGHYEAELAWASADEPYLHKIPVQTRNSYQAKVTGDTIVFARGGLPMTDRSLYEVGVTDFTGRVRLLRSSDAKAFYPDSSVFDFDGKRLAWVQAGCHRAVIRVEDVATPPLIEKRRPCPLRLATAPKVRDGRVILDPVCEVKCFTRYLTLTTVERFRVGGRPPRRVRVGKSAHTGSTTIRLKREAKRLLAKRGKLRIQVSGTVSNLPGERREPRTMTVTLGEQR